MSEGIIAALVVFGFIGLAWFADVVDKHKPKIKGVQPRIEAYKKEKGRIKKISA